MESSKFDWLFEVLQETGLEQFYSKLGNDLQLTQMSHFDFVTEDDLIQVGMSRPASKRLLSAIKKRKSFVTSIKNKFFNKLIPTPSTSLSASSSSPNSSSKNKNNHNNPNILASNCIDGRANSSEFGRLSCLINSQDVLIKEEIGHGAHGFVKKGEWTAPNGRVVEVAVKILRKDVMSDPNASFNDFVKEISIMHQLNHPNIIKLYGVVLSSPMMMVTELAPYGNLRDKLRQDDGCIPISQLINFGVQISSGMSYLESRRFVHRDLAARNIFITHGKKILIGDLGLMRAVPNQKDHYVMNERTKIPYPWCAPESLKFRQFSSASDVYMFGVTLWEMFSFGKEPWAGLNLNEIVDRISTHDKRLPCPEACPNMVYQTLLQCWNIDPSKRPNFTTLYQYLSTSYPLEVISTQTISDLTHKRADGNLIVGECLPSESTAPKTLAFQESSSSSSEVSNSGTSSPVKILNCFVEDRIYVIDGQPEKYWWKGQNQRTFEIGWFPLCSTRWLTPKKAMISKPLKNSFVHASHIGFDKRWAHGIFLDKMSLSNAIDLETNPSSKCAIKMYHKQKLAKSPKASKISRLFRMHETSANPTFNCLTPNEYRLFNNNASHHNHQQERTKTTSSNLNKFHQDNKMSSSASDEPTSKYVADPFPAPQVDEAPPLIDLSDEAELALCFRDTQLVNSNLATFTPDQRHSLIDMENPSVISEADQGDQVQATLQRRASDTNLDRVYGGSFCGSWNTGTFYGSNANIYSAYYCPQDGTVTNELQPNSTDLNLGQTSVDTNRYYSFAE